jgi:hypothetical protein
VFLTFFNILRNVLKYILIKYAHDAVQLASALNLKDVLQKLGNSLIFVSADEALCDAARAESLSVNNPNDY